jgi:RNA polymerase sigma-70 factor (ECF subfamily)
MAVHTPTLIGGMRERDDELAALARAAGRGSAAAFDTLARRVRDRVRTWARELTNDEDDAEDVAQLVLLRLHAHVDRFDGRSRFTTWLFRVTRNVTLSRQHRERRRQDLLSRQDATATDSSHEHAHDDAAGERIRMLLACCDDLPRRQCEVFELADLRGVESNEIATRLGITPSTVRGLLMKARRRIRLRMLEAHPHLLDEFTP